MGTRSVVGLKTGRGWFGRYVHWDGYPEGVGAAVWHIVKRDGIGTAVQTLLMDNYSWSNLSMATEEDPDDPRGLKFVSGYGYAHTDVEADGIITDNGDKWGTEYAYILSREGLSVNRVDENDFVHEIGFYRWDMEGEPDFVRRARERFGQAVTA